MALLLYFLERQQKTNMKIRIPSLASIAVLAVLIPASLALATPRKALTTQIIRAKPKSASTKPANAPKVPDLKNAPKVQAPAFKGGPKTKDAYIRLHVDNRSGRYANVWVDDTYQGIVSPYGDIYCNVNPYFRIYCEDADGNYWNFSMYRFLGTTYTYTLLP